MDLIKENQNPFYPRTPVYGENFLRNLFERGGWIAEESTNAIANPRTPGTSVASGWRNLLKILEYYMK